MDAAVPECVDGFFKRELDRLLVSRRIDEVDDVLVAIKCNLCVEMSRDGLVLVQLRSIRLPLFSPQ
jgi:hypothetical protein